MWIGSSNLRGKKGVRNVSGTLFAAFFPDGRRGRLRGRSVVSKPNAVTALLVHDSSPNGLPLCTQRRRAANSDSVCGSLTQAGQSRGRETGQVESNWRSERSGCVMRQRLPQFHASARFTSPARRAFRSTYRQTA